MTLREFDDQLRRVTVNLNIALTDSTPVAREVIIKNAIADLKLIREEVAKLSRRLNRIRG